MSIIPEHFLKQLKPLIIFKDLPVQVKRQVWEHDIDFFKETLNSLVELYIKNDSVEVDVTGDHPVDPKRRREGNSALKQIVEVVGPSQTLYDALLGAVDAKLNQSKGKEHLSLCNLRFEVLQSLNDSKFHQVDACQYLCSWIEPWMRNVQNQLLTLTTTMVTQEIIQEFSVTRKMASPTITSSS
ncbi:NELF-B, partial [Acrasis kona]